MTANVTDIHTEIAEANKKFMDAFARADPAGIAALHTEAGQILPPGMIMVTGKDSIEAFWRGAMEAGVKRADLNTIELDPQGDTAIEIGRAHLYSEAGDMIDDTKYVVVWKKEGADWKIHRDIWNSDSSPD